MMSAVWRTWLKSTSCCFSNESLRYQHRTIFNDGREDVCESQVKMASYLLQKTGCKPPAASSCLTESYDAVFEYEWERTSFPLLTKRDGEFGGKNAHSVHRRIYIWKKNWIRRRRGRGMIWKNKNHRSTTQRIASGKRFGGNNSQPDDCCCRRWSLFWSALFFHPLTFLSFKGRWNTWAEMQCNPEGIGTQCSNSWTGWLPDTSL